MGLVAVSACHDMPSMPVCQGFGAFGAFEWTALGVHLALMIGLCMWVWARSRVDHR